MAAGRLQRLTKSQMACEPAGFDGAVTRSLPFVVTHNAAAKLRRIMPKAPVSAANRRNPMIGVSFSVRYAEGARVNWVTLRNMLPGVVDAVSLIFSHRRLKEALLQALPPTRQRQLGFSSPHLE